MKIAMISYHTCPLASFEGKETGGMNIYVLELSKALAKMGHSVFVFTRIQDEKSREIVDVNPNLKVIHLKGGAKGYVAKKDLIKYINEFTGNLKSYIAKNHLTFDLIHSHYYMSGMVGLQLKLPHVMTFHTLALMKNLVARDINERESKTRIENEFLLVKKSSRIISSSASDKDYLTYLYDCPGEKISAITPGVDIKLFKPINKDVAKKSIGLNISENMILFVGRLEPLKGIDVLLYALKIFLHRHPDFPLSLLIVGGRREHPELKRLKEIEKTLRIKPVVKFIHQKPQNLLPYYYNAADLLLMPSHYESFGITALEAMACGTPVVTTDVSGISSIIDPEFKEYIISANNPLLLANQIEEMLVKRKSHNKFRAAMLNKIKNLTWDNAAEKVSDVYSDVLKHRSNFPP